MNKLIHIIKKQLKNLMNYLKIIKHKNNHNIKKIIIRFNKLIKIKKKYKKNKI